MNTKLVLAAFLLSAVLLVMLPTGSSECCGYWYIYTKPQARHARRNPPIKRCADCSRPNWRYCAADRNGGCDIVGCNCDGGCRQPVPGRNCSYSCCDDRSDRNARDVDEVFLREDVDPMPFEGTYTARDVMDYLDLNKDGKLDEPEMVVYLTRQGLPVDAAWRAMDGDGDGALSVHEIDARGQTGGA